MASYNNSRLVKIELRFTLLHEKNVMRTYLFGRAIDLDSDVEDVALRSLAAE